MILDLNMGAFRDGDGLLADFGHNCIWKVVV
jgi:hypothetical protein